MNLKTVTDALSEAEQDALELIASASQASSPTNRDYDLLQDYLILAKGITQIREQAEVLSGRMTKPLPGRRATANDTAVRRAATASRPARISSPSEPASAMTYPAYCFVDGSLVKVGAKRDGKGTYKKAVPLDDVASICDTISASLNNDGEALIAKVTEAHPDLASYKPQIVLTALAYGGLLRQTGRGRYASAPGNSMSSASSLRDALERLPSQMPSIERTN